MSDRKSMFFQDNGIDLVSRNVAYWKYNGNSIDSGVNGLNGAITGAVTYPTGMIGQCIDFGNNTNVNYFNVSDNDYLSFPLYTKFSICLWVYQHAEADSLPGHSSLIFCKRGGSGGSVAEYQLANYVYDDRLKFILFSNSSSNYVVYDITKLPVGSWTHIAISSYNTLNSLDTHIYVNGIKQSPIITNVSYVGMSSTNVPFTCGISTWSTFSTKLKGRIDDLIIYKNKKLNSHEVLNIYNKGLAGQPIF